MVSNMERKRTNNYSSKSKLREIIKESYLGVIEDINDPDQKGRCKIRVFGVFGDKDSQIGSIPTEDLPWAYPSHQLSFGAAGAGSFSTPKKNSIVRIFFEDDVYHPYYYTIEDLDPDLKAELAADYEDFHSLLFDSKIGLKILYTQKTGFLIDFNNSFFNIDPNGSLIIHHKESSSIIELRGDVIDINSKNQINVSSPNLVTVNSDKIHVNGVNTDVGANPIYSNMNGEQVFKLFLIMATGLDSKYPSTPGQFAQTVKNMEKVLLSGTVKTSP